MGAREKEREIVDSVRDTQMVSWQRKHCLLYNIKLTTLYTHIHNAAAAAAPVAKYYTTKIATLAWCYKQYSVATLLLGSEVNCCDEPL